MSSSIKFAIFSVLIFGVLMELVVSRSIYSADDNENGAVLGEPLSFPMIYGNEMNNNLERRFAAMNEEPSIFTQKRAMMRLGKRAMLRLGKKRSVGLMDKRARLRLG
ncbi:hypothetical protein M3Y98_00385800 [Aphelenchoides besseyi]|nr:hypothetical protein M3Y98_00385800 [Aphelenchoides besseyi]KAI6201929.1 hypothetical protein M3Y96_00894300 [Aphelenchoides besseyi]